MAEYQTGLSDTRAVARSILLTTSLLLAIGACGRWAAAKPPDWIGSPLALAPSEDATSTAGLLVWSGVVGTARVGSLVSSISADATGRLLVTHRSGATSISVRDAKTLVRLHSWSFPSGRPSAVKISPDGELVLLGTDRGWLDCWSTRKARSLWRLRISESAVDSVSFAPNAARVAACAAGKVSIRECVRGKLLHEWTSSPAPDTVVWSPIGDDLLLFSGGAKRIMRWSAQGSHVATYETDASLSACAWSLTADRVLAGTTEGVLMELSANSPDGRFLTKLDGAITDIVVSSRHRVILASTFQGSVSAVSPTGRQFCSQAAGVRELFGLVSGGNRVFAAGADGIQSFTLRREANSCALEPPAPPPATVSALDTDKSGTLLCVKTGRWIAVRGGPSGGVLGSWNLRRGHRDCDMASDGTRVLALGGDGHVSIRSQNGKLIVTLEAEDIVAACFDDRGNRAATVSSSGQVFLWTLEKNNARRILISDHMRLVSSMTFANRSRWLALGTKRGNIAVWDIKSRTQVSGARISDHPITRIRAIGESRQLAVSPVLGPLQIVDGKTGKPVAALGTQTSGGLGLSVDPSGKWVFSGDSDGFVRVWDLQSARLLDELKLARRPINAVSFSQAGLWIGMPDSTVRLYRFKPPR